MKQIETPIEIDPMPNSTLNNEKAKKFQTSPEA